METKKQLEDNSKEKSICTKTIPKEQDKLASTLKQPKTMPRKSLLVCDNMVKVNDNGQQ